MEYHRAGRVYDFNPVGFGLPVRGRRLTVGTQEHFGVVQGRERGVVDGDEAEFFQTVAFLAEWVPAGASPMCGNSICQDRRFLHRLMPRLEKYFHYRNLDVSTLKELARRWAPQVLEGVRKQASHTALSDVRDSIEELRHYRRHMAALAGE